MMSARLATAISLKQAELGSLNLGAPMTLTATTSLLCSVLAQTCTRNPKDPCPVLVRGHVGPGYPFQHGEKLLPNRSRLVVNKPVPARTRYLGA